MVIDIPYVSLYPRLAHPLNATRLRGQVRERKNAVGLAQTPWQAVGAVFRYEVQRAIYASQDNGLARAITGWAGEGSRCLPREVHVPDMPPKVVRAGALGLVGAACVFGATQILPWVGLTVLGLVCEASAALGVGLRLAMAGVAAAGGAVAGAWRGARMGARWHRTTTWHTASTPTVEKLGPAFADSFAGSAWPPVWETLQDTEVSPQFVRDVARGDTLACSLNWEDEAVGLEEVLSMLPSTAHVDTPEARQNAAVDRLKKLCDGDKAWVSHVTCVLNQSLGNIPAAALVERMPLRQGGQPVSPANSPATQRHTVTRRSRDTLVVTGKLGWSKGCRVSDPSGNVLVHGTSTPLWFTYRMTLERPQRASDPPQTQLEAVAWTLTDNPVRIPPPRSPRTSLQDLNDFSASFISSADPAL